MNTDQLQRYSFTSANVRGEMVQLQSSFADVISTTAYPHPVQQLLGEMLAAATLLTATLKFEGEISLQIQSQGLIKYAIVDATDTQQVRGIARWDETVTEWPTSFPELFAQGVLAITITPKKGERYQGLVGLTNTSLAECLQDYFEQSEQLATKVLLFADPDVSNPKAAGMLLQVLPESSAATVVSAQSAFNELAILTDTITQEEILSLDARTILHRLYHEHDVELFEPKPVSFGCTCSKERSAQALKNIEKQELLSIVAEQGQIEMDCQYCHAQYVFDAMDVETIHAGFSSNLDNTRSN